MGQYNQALDTSHDIVTVQTDEAVNEECLLKNMAAPSNSLGLATYKSIKKELSLLRLFKIVHKLVCTDPIFNMADCLMNIHCRKKVLPSTTILCQRLQISKLSANSRNC